MNRLLICFSFIALTAFVPSFLWAQIDEPTKPAKRPTMALIGYGGAGQYGYIGAGNRDYITSQIVIDTIFRYAPTGTEADLYSLSILEMTADRKFRGTTVTGFLGVEIRDEIGPYIHVQAGITHVSARERCSSNCGNIGNIYRLSMLAEPSANLSMLGIRNLFLGSRIIEPKIWNYQYTLAQGAILFHPFENRTIDPFIGIELGFGVCSAESINASCNAYSAGVRTGIRYNVNDQMFVQLQAAATKEMMSFVTDEESFTLELPTVSPFYTFGVGFWLF